MLKPERSYDGTTSDVCYTAVLVSVLCVVCFDRCSLKFRPKRILERTEYVAFAQNELHKSGLNV